MNFWGEEGENLTRIHKIKEKEGQGCNLCTEQLFSLWKPFHTNS